MNNKKIVIVASCIIIIGLIIFLIQPKTEQKQTTPQQSTAQSGVLDKKKLKSDDEWKRVLNPEQYHILREKGTETPLLGNWNMKIVQVLIIAWAAMKRFFGQKKSMIQAQVGQVSGNP